ncbi:hypothetical protein O3G_MSEX005357 [Manduca sexta]|uniref:Uncharacterized protein n=1 Tax=Manduca sexta TaxID=7130 RepID=A0A921YZG5_MANSE|nr:hypothetical protein O3G_MSEX005357 [Manduca sexta]
MATLGFSGGECGAVLRLLAFMLKLGNVQFEPQHNIDGTIGVRINQQYELTEACALVGVDADALAAALAAPRDARRQPADDEEGEEGVGEECEGEVPAEQADEAEAGSAEWASALRDRLVCALYSRLFTWLITAVNEALHPRAAGKRCSLGILDAYGFERLARNGLERLLINYAAERVQAAVTGATLRREQEEYAREGLSWRPLRYFDHEAHADLLDAGPDSVLGALREARSDTAFLQRLQRRRHPRLLVQPPDKFQVAHFGGAVTYSARGIVEKNLDAVCRRCGSALAGAREPLLAALFAAGQSPRRPAALACRQRALVAALVRRLNAPRLVRCLRPDAALRPHRFDAPLLRHQIRTQGIMDMALLRRAGWCESMCARVLLARYGPLRGGAGGSGAESASASPRASPAPRDCPVRAARALLRTLPIPSAEFAYGRTRVFIRSPRTVWELEALRSARVEELVVRVQRAWRRYRARKHAAVRRHAQRILARAWRAYRLALFSTHHARARYRRRAHTHHARHTTCAAFDQTARNRMREKVTASVLFKDRKANYARSVAHPFVGDYVRLRASAAWRRGLGAGPADRYVVFADVVGKVARSSGRVSRCLAVVSTAALVLLEPRSLRLKRRVPAHQVYRLSLSPFDDDLLVVHVRACGGAESSADELSQCSSRDAPDAPGCLFGGEGAWRRRGDVVMRTCHVLELATKLFLVVQNAVGAPPHVNIASEFEANFGQQLVTVSFHAVGGEGGGARLMRRGSRMDVLL